MGTWGLPPSHGTATSLHLPTLCFQHFPPKKGWPQPVARCTGAGGRALPGGATRGQRGPFGALTRSLCLSLPPRCVFRSARAASKRGPRWAAARRGVPTPTTTRVPSTQVSPPAARRGAWCPEFCGLCPEFGCSQPKSSWKWWRGGGCVPAAARGPPLTRPFLLAGCLLTEESFSLRCPKHKVSPETPGAPPGEGRAAFTPCPPPQSSGTSPSLAQGNRFPGAPHETPSTGAVPPQTVFGFFLWDFVH